MEMYVHVVQCDNCQTKVTFPNSWRTDNPPNNGWISIVGARGTKYDFCPFCKEAAHTQLTTEHIVK